MMKCDYCDEMHGMETVYSKIYGPGSRVIHETESFLVFPCMGQLREGHLLMVSKAHKNAAGMLEADAIARLETLAADLSRFFQEVYRRDLLCFEHGVLDDQGGNGGCGIYHMHLHLIPASRREFDAALELIRRDEANLIRPAEGLLDTRACVAAGQTYLYLSFLEKTKRRDALTVTRDSNFFESQYMRKIICQVFGKTDWDWRTKQTPEPELLRTLQKGYAFFHP